MEGGGHKIGHNRRIGDKSPRAELMLTPRKERIYRWSGWPDLNRRPHAPQACALPGCATPRPQKKRSEDADYNRPCGEATAVPLNTRSVAPFAADSFRKTHSLCSRLNRIARFCRALRNSSPRITKRLTTQVCLAFLVSWLAEGLPNSASYPDCGFSSSILTAMRSWL